MLIRRPRPGEGPRLRALRLRALREAPFAFGSNHERELGIPAEEWEQRAVGAEHEVVFVAEIDGAWVGMAGAFPAARTGAVTVWGMWVAPEARGSGAGTALLDALVTWARDAGAARLELCVTDPADAAARLYERAGFRPTGARGEMRPGLMQTELAVDL